ncbi:MAG TPA: hypothetical protein PK390_04890 [Fervidobacterium nodosum]|nr:hypothetical protein [Fervidobacterium nodosum]
MPAIKTVTKYNIQQYGVGAGGTSFILLAFNDSSVEGVWFENIN